MKERGRDRGIGMEGVVGRKKGRKKIISTLEESSKYKVGDRKEGGPVSCTAYITFAIFSTCTHRSGRHIYYLSPSERYRVGVQ